MKKLSSNDILIFSLMLVMFIVSIDAIKVACIIVFTIKDYEWNGFSNNSELFVLSFFPFILSILNPLVYYSKRNKSCLWISSFWLFFTFSYCGRILGYNGIDLILIIIFSFMSFIGIVIFHPKQH